MTGLIRLLWLAAHHIKPLSQYLHIFIRITVNTNTNMDQLLQHPIWTENGGRETAGKETMKAITGNKKEEE